MRYIKKLEDIPQLSDAERAALKPVADAYAFRVSEYYLGLIDWNDPADPIRQLVIPRTDELNDWGKLDASNEAANTVMRGVQHKYPDTALLLCNEVCGAYCRYCFRKRLFMNDNDEASKDLREGIEYIAAHPEITNVLLTGGDPLLLSTRRLTEVIEALRQIEHVRIIRIGTKMTAFNPWRVLDDPALLEMFAKYSTPHKRIYVMNHFDHPRELTDAAVEGLDKLIRAGAIMTNQCPMIAGINDDPAVLSDMFRQLSWIGCPPYYLFQGRPTAGNDPYKVPIVRGWEIFREALRHGAGLARRARFVMSHETGKVEVLAVDDKHIYLRYHRAKDASLRGRFLIYRRDDEACWLDDLVPAEGSDAPRFAPDGLLETGQGPE
ncbi:MAG: KamA family radical SAM protein [Gammaproteobacteria bacterium]|nr:KamA family radical SAM protein [Gammaproteobacteria bacterium]MBU1647516.1 KamA family radical SAM protein [Gammaproteobacteria bacterium]MBU1972965.1 KamA family radical SAM protein [Gammaproteobacteria bacterium]